MCLNNIEYYSANLNNLHKRNKQFNKKNKKEITCNCKKTCCLKLYCECFAANKDCRNCKCISCDNNSGYYNKNPDILQTRNKKKQKKQKM